ncbi:MAG: hypothetical protein IKS31_12190 [Clostridia bacterium]|nr:hypothetical protein [Clostridia bacterium]
MGFFGPSREEREQARKLMLDKYTHVAKVKPMGVAISEEGSDNMFTNYVNYAFLLQFDDGHRELYSGKQDDEIVGMLLDKIDM